MKKENNTTYSNTPTAYYDVYNGFYLGPRHPITQGRYDDEARKLLPILYRQAELLNQHPLKTYVDYEERIKKMGKIILELNNKLKS